jgi:hypothetical protein
MASLKADFTVLRADFGSFRREALDEMGKLELRMTVKLGSMLAGAVILTGAMVKLL